MVRLPHHVPIALSTVEGCGQSSDSESFYFVIYLLFVVNLLNPNLLLLELRHDLVGEQANAFYRHLLRHAAEVEGAGDRRQPVGLGPFTNRIRDPLRIAGQDKPLGDLRLGVALDQ